MTIPSVAADDPVEAATANQLIANVNSSPGRVILLANTLWSVPDGVHKFKVTIAGGGGRGGSSGVDGGGFPIAGGEGGRSPMISALFSGVAIGTSFSVTIGAGGTVGTPTGGTTSFGSTFSSTGGGIGSSSPTTPTEGSFGTATFPAGAPSFFHINEMFVADASTGLRGYGRGGASDSDGIQGAVIIEW